MLARIRLSPVLIASLFVACGDDDQRFAFDAPPDSAAAEVLSPDTPETDSASPETIAPDTAGPETVPPDTTEPETTAPDTVPADTTEPDTAPADTTEPDTAVPDTSEPDTFVPDTVPADTVEPDTFVPDTTPADIAETEVVIIDNAPPGVLGYSRIDNIVLVDDLQRVAWHPTGAFALIAGRGGKLAIWKPDSPLAVIGTLGADITDLLALASGDFAVLEVTQGVVRITVDPDAGSFTTNASTKLPVGAGRALAAEPFSDRVAIAAHGTDSISYLYTWTPDALTPVKGFNASAGISDVMWGSPPLYAGSANLITAHGHNGADSKTYVLASDLVIGNNWSGGFGNAGGSAWRPGGGYGVVCGWSSNKLYVFDGVWEMATLPVPTGASPNAIAWKADGQRALVVGRVIASPAYAVVIELRPGTSGPWPAPMVDQSIRNFTEAPWLGNSSSMHLLDVAWRPGAICDEGIIVGTDSGPSFSPGFGYAIHFWDLDDPICQPKP